MSSGTQKDKRSTRGLQPINYSETASRRTSKEVSKEKEAKRQAAAQAEIEEQEAIDEVAVLEKAARQKTQERLRNPGAVYLQDPDIKNTSSKNRKRPAASTFDSQGDAKRAGRNFRKVVTYVAVDDADDDPFEENDPTFDAAMREIDNESGSGSDYEPAQATGEHDDDDDDEGAELEEDEPDQNLAKKRKRDGGREKGGKPMKAGAQHRARVRESRDDSDDTSDSTPTRPRKQQKQKGTKGRDGLLNSWQKNSEAILRKAPTKAPSGAESDDEGPVQKFGGLVRDNEDMGLERQALFKDTADLVKENTKLLPIDSSSKVLKKPKNGTSPRNNTPRAKVNLLPQAGQEKWKSIKAELINIIAGQAPWTALEDDTIAKVWNRCTENKCPVEVTSSVEDSPESRLWTNIRSLIQNQVIPTEWRFKFAHSAVKSVKAEWDRRGLVSEGDVEAWVAKMLGPEASDRHSKQRPFIWGHCNSLDWDGTDPSVTGIGGDLFMGRLVLQVFAVHFEIIGSRVPEDKQEKRPYGALCMAIQAVNRALELSISGKMCIPEKGDPLGHFSQENWGDFTMEKQEKGRHKHVLVRRATRFLATMQALDDTQWEEIITAAKAFTTFGGKQDGGRRKLVKSLPEVEESEDEIIIDPKRITRPHGSPKTPATHSSRGAGAQDSSRSKAPSSDSP